ncbi:MAG: Crp/Fnr family transcriptional regulator [Actinobacteria bacterium]|nr:Crp/Fnr family transcriptional regulator [Actinomycetota bacterium]
MQRESMRSPAPSDAGTPSTRGRYLSTVDIYQDLGELELRTVDQSLRTSAVPKGRLVYQPDETGEGLFVLKSGLVQLYRISPDGKRFVVANVEPSTFFGEMAFVGKSMFGSFAETLEDSVICVMSRGDLERLIRRHPQVGIRITQALAERLNAAETQLEDLALKSLAALLATLILRLTNEDASRVIGLTHNDLGRTRGHLARDGHPSAQRAEGGGPHCDRPQAYRGGGS